MLLMQFILRKFKVNTAYNVSTLLKNLFIHLYKTAIYN